ncbi:SDR family oxidoreductase [Herbaspirillum robiniae]|uniref:SDR family NAD(P)-dependent oxidoreductase n=1 Tax=Herbaspirillum robiniae TaxID=2014887 RepID=A0A246WV53_9BURK|nr:SDR family NAD(P)-dependent oxidoreductase [Herbaspirillum robiniae]NUU03678.1 SDR family NAD(P)-dependent oxidoreductase [Herbaspirillum robiniae]OWY30153.1 short-chain dehydrogenase [Herbaspirillum robiniae]
MNMTDNTIFITGGTSGIGRGLAQAFHRLGNRVIIAGRRKALLDEITAAHPGMRSVELDINDPEDIRAVGEWLAKEFPTLNVLVNNAGIMPFDNAAGAIDDAVMQSIITTNLYGPIRMTAALVEHLKKQPRALILNNTSVLAFTPLAMSAVYSASKAALHSYSLSQRFMLRDTSVKVQEIAPPWVNTDLVGKTDDPRAMPLDAFIEQTIAALASDAPEVVVEAARQFRDNAGPNEHGFVHGFNQMLVDDPLPL